MRSEKVVFQCEEYYKEKSHRYIKKEKTYTYHQTIAHLTYLISICTNRFFTIMLLLFEPVIIKRL
jgi:hypothetical protein